jgi:hypothetical protein
MGSELTVILGDFFLTSRPRQADAPPRLAALELLLARAECTRLPEGWRAWLAQQAASGDAVHVAPASLAARAWLAPPAGAHSHSYWFATPVHYLAGIDSVHLHPDGLLQLMPDEQAALAADFNALFGDSHWRLHALGHRELLLCGPRLQASAADPGDWAGRDPSGGAPRGPDAATLLRLGSEIEMWLHEHRINGARQARSQLAVTGLWLWGSTPGAAARAAVRGALPVLHGSDLYAEGLWRLAGRSAEPLPEEFQALPIAADAHAIVLYPALGADGLAQRLAQLERRWIAPALAALRARRLRTLRLLAGERVYRLQRLGLARFWRAGRPWWEALA